MTSETAGQVRQALDRAETEFPPRLAEARTAQDLEQVRVQFLGRKSGLTAALKQLPALAPGDRAAIGQRANALKRTIEARLSERRQQLAQAPAAPSVDATLPGSAFPRGRAHPLSDTIEAIVGAFEPLGFEIVEGPEVEFEYYNFDALNIPADHPSRESFDTFFLDAPSPDPAKGRLVLRSHTSPVQIRAMEQRTPPLRILVPGTVYRPDPLDPSHSFMFHQVEGLMVDERVSFADLKGVLEQCVKALFGAEARTRFRPHYFPFTEPSAEVDIACAACRGAGCSTCGRKGWLEIMGCGMVHPNVFKAVGYDPRTVQGFAFGMGVERIAMLTRGVADIRLFFENDLRFLEQW